MKMEYIAISVCVAMTIIAIMVGIMIYKGSALWGKIRMTKNERFLFLVYLAAMRVKMDSKKIKKENYLLHLVKIHAEITALDINFNAAKKEFESRTTIELLDVYNDQLGNRYIRMRDRIKGDMIYSLQEYLQVALDCRISEEMLQCAPQDANPETIKELTRKALLKRVK